MKFFGVLAAWLISAALAFAGPISGYPAASTPYNATDQILGTVLVTSQAQANLIGIHIRGSTPVYYRP